MPYSWYTKNTRAKWSGTDNTTNYNLNPQAHQWENVDIQYNYNAQGFRTHDLASLTGQQVDVALGCSFTEGIGLPEDMSWPSLIEQQGSYPMLNLGLGSGCTDTVSRILTNICGMFTIRTVFIMWPDQSRFETYNAAGKIYPLLPTSARPEHTWNMEDITATTRFDKNANITKLLATIYNFQIISLPMQQVHFSMNLDKARDGLHYGIRSQIAMAEWFTSRLTS